MFLKEEKLKALDVQPPKRDAFSGHLSVPARYPLRALSPILVAAIEAAGMNPNDFEGSIAEEFVWDYLDRAPEEPNGNALHIALNPAVGLSVAVYVSSSVPAFPAWFYSEHPTETAMYWMSEFRDQSHDPEAPQNMPTGPSSPIDQRPAGITLQ
ncbi:hypothetical protein [Neorhizobium petrolearium]|uniref:hypothetical protein n=1 Tax=Neorhizobium petrolearium TaxID=515361 RepID=UPI003F147787